MAKQVTDQGNSVQQQSASRCRPRLSFSIDSILGRDDENALGQKRVQKAEETYDRGESVERETRSIASVDAKIVANLPWLSYTRYSPPKLPRSKRKLKNCKRRSSGSPRVPFSSTQLRTLEQTYMGNRYLSGPQVAELSADLKLPHHRIKIWFQNRRAREKRNQEGTPLTAVSGECLPLLQQQQGGRKCGTSCFVPFTLNASFSMNCFALANQPLYYNMLDKCIDFDAYSWGKMGF